MEGKIWDPYLEEVFNRPNRERPGFSNMWTMNFQMFKLVLEKAEEQGSNCQHPLDHGKSKNSRKTATSALLTMPKPLTMWITINCGKF